MERYLFTGDPDSKIMIVKGQRSQGKVYAISVELNNIANKRTALFASEILEEIKAAINSNYAAIFDRENHLQSNSYDDPFCERCRGKIDALRGLGDFIEENISKFIYNDNDPTEATQ